jgi:predicted permease
MPNIHEPQLVNTVGHAAGAIIFGIFLFLLLHDRRGRLRESWRSITAAALAFLWNVGSLGVIVSATLSSAVGVTKDVITQLRRASSPESHPLGTLVVTLLVC